MKFLKQQAGDTIVEVLIALTVLTFALGTGFAIVGKSNLSLQGNKEQFQAQLLVNEQLEYVRLTNAGLDNTNERQRFDGNGCFKKESIGIKETAKYVTGSANCNNISMGGANIYNVQVQCYGSTAGVAGYGTSYCNADPNTLTVYSVIVTWPNIKGTESRLELQYGM